MNRLANRSLILVATATILAACGGDTETNGGNVGPGADARSIVLFDARILPPDSGPIYDAVPPDACQAAMCEGMCVDLTTDIDFCGSCDNSCSRLHGCSDSACGECPEAFLPKSIVGVDPSFSENNPPSLRMRDTIEGPDGLSHRITINWDSSIVVADADYDLASADAIFFGVYYNRGGDGPRGTLAATAGTLRLTRVCSDGVAGTLTAATLEERGFGGPVEGGCELAKTTLSFDFGGDCNAAP